MDDAGAAIDELRAALDARIGRNLVLYQRIENGLKHLLIGSRIEGTPTDIVERMQAWNAKVMRMNMGEAAKAVFEYVLTATPRELPAKPDTTQIRVRTTLSLEPSADDPDEFRRLAERCKAVVDRRNDLVHHFLRQWRLDTEAELRAAMDDLDSGHAEAAALRTELLQIMQIYAEARRALAADLNSPQWQRQLELGMAQGNVIGVLEDVASACRREGGWEFVSTALHRLNASVASDVARLKEAFGKDWLVRTFEAAADTFEVTVEPTPNAAPGANRRLYRLRPARQ